MPGNFYRNRFALLIDWAEGLKTLDGQLAAMLLKDIWSDIKDDEMGDVDDASDPRQEENHA